MQVLKDEVRNKIYLSALKEFKEKGFEKASMRSIAKSADITVGNMYRYFRNKDDLFYEIISPAYNKVVEYIIRQKDPNTIVQELANRNIDKQTNEIVEIYLQHRDELLIIIDGSKGSKYERAKEDIIKLVEEIIINLLGAIENKALVDDFCFAHVLSVTVIEGVILIFKNQQKDEDVKKMVQQYIGFIFKNFAERIKE